VDLVSPADANREEWHLLIVETSKAGRAQASRRMKILVAAVAVAELDMMAAAADPGHHNMKPDFAAS
jgi:hypothetical protein